ncbi:discoidin domain-containing protein [Paenibacillus sp. 1001270B_150601_E10]|uniref:discoidin domain-containing protein n=1 Tax=Paenibacillus sp. 1001270B_150601_E10 TaxID=2787079 RepID=UPI0018A06252|nr:discoidin domain-containing protein [Paenibacillus sp. 1001270B_150601_E10]
MKPKKWIMFSIAVMLLFSMLPLSAALAAAGVPGTPVLTHDNWDGDGDYTITMSMYWGENGTSLELYENNVRIETQALTDGTPNPQTATKAFTGKVNGTYTYTAKLINSHGSTMSQPVTVNVTNGNTAPAPEVEVTNFTNNETIHYSFPLIRGIVSDTSATTITLTNTSSNRSTKVIQGQVHQGRFKVFADLIPGENNLVIQNGTKQTTLTLNYEPNTSNAVTRIFWYVPSDGNTQYQTQLANDPQNYEAKLSTYMKVIQSFTADSMNNNGYGRKTFNLEMNQLTGKVEVHVLKSQHPASYYYNTSYNKDDLYGEVASLIPAQYPQAGTKNLAFVGFSKYDAAAQYMYAHIALGGGDYGVFGGSTVWLFPNDETEVLSKFADLGPVDPAFVGEPATTVQKAISIGYGAALHELGHAFGLPHEGGPNSIMLRGFDWLHRFFVLKDADGYVFNENELPAWDPVSAITLNNSPFFKAGQQPGGLTVGGTITVSNDNSPAGEGKENAFDNNDASKWLTFNSSSHIQYQFEGTNAYAVKTYSITSANDFPERDPRNWTLSGSNDGTNWTVLDTRLNESFASRYQTKSYSISNTTAYRYYKFDLANNSGGILQLADIRLYD